jgi:IS30 family transposase
MGYHHLTLRERYIIQELRGLEKSLSFIAAELGVNKATVSREVKRNSNTKGDYRALGAQGYSEARRRHIVEYPRKIKGALQELVIQKLEEGWSPEQITGRLKLEGKESVSVEGIYRYILMDRKCGGNLYKFLRRHGRKPRRGYRRNRHWIKIERRRFIDERGTAANERTATGHWERDLVHGLRGGPAVLSIVDRKSRYTLLEKVQNQLSQESAAKTEKAFRRTKLKCKSLTNDNGPEFGAFHHLEKTLRAKIYFTHPYCSWERGTNENTNGLLRQYLPKNRSYRKLTDDYLRKIEEKLNQRPRKTLGFRTPEEIHFTKKTKLIKGKKEIYKDKLERFIEETYRLSVALDL